MSLVISKDSISSKAVQATNDLVCIHRRTSSLKGRLGSLWSWYVTASLPLKMSFNCTHLLYIVSVLKWLHGEPQTTASVIYASMASYTVYSILFACTLSWHQLTSRYSFTATENKSFIFSCVNRKVGVLPILRFGLSFDGYSWCSARCQPVLRIQGDLSYGWGSSARYEMKLKDRVYID